MALQTDRPAATAAAPADRVRRRFSLRRPQRPLRWWHEVLFIAVLYAIYTLGRDLIPANAGPAFAHAADIVSIEKTLGIFHELGANHWLAAHRPLAVTANYIYATLHFIVTILVGGWVLWKHPRHARSLRIAWYSTNLVALIGFAVYPLAPPRLLPHSGFVDTVVRFGTWGSWGKHGVDQVSNQYAAMPSLHIGWSTWCAIVVCTLATRWWVRVLAVCYPVLILGVIVGTANHYFLDAVFGLVTLGIGFAVQRLITGHGAFSSPPLAHRGTEPDEEPVPG